MYPEPEQKVVTPAYAYQSDMNYAFERMRQLEKKIRIIMAILQEKKLISEEFARVIMEVDTKKENLINWYLAELKKE